MPATHTFEKMTIDATTPQATDPAKTTTGGKKAQKMIITVETNDARMKINAAPVAAEGVLLKKDVDPYEITGFDTISNAQFIGTAANAILNIQYILI